MKFIRIYLLTFIIARDNCVEGSGELSEEDLKLIADRLYPEECFRLLNYLRGSQETWGRRVTGRRGYRDEWVTENSRIQCLESLYECNQRGKKIGCTRNSIEAALHKLGRADLASRLQKRKNRNKSKRRNMRPKQKTGRTGRSDKGPRRNYKEHSKNKDVKSHVRGTRRKDLLFGGRFMIFIVAGSIILLVSLGCIVIVSYRRACRCYKNYLHLTSDERDERLYTFGKSSAGQSRGLEESNKPRGPATSGRQKMDEQSGGYTGFALQSDKEKNNSLIRSNDVGGSPDIGRTKNVSFDSAEETEYDACKCDSVEAQSKRTMSPCARIKRFFHSQKRRVREEGDAFIMRKRDRRVSERMKIGKSSIERAVAKKSIGQDDSATGTCKNRRKKTGKHSSSRGKVVNRERRWTAVKSNRIDTRTSRPLGCTCQMCKLFNVTGEGGCNERAMERQRLTRRRNR